LERGEHAEHEDDEKRRESSATKLEQLVAELPPLLPRHGDDVAHHDNAPSGRSSLATSSRNASSNDGCSRRTSSISTPSSSSSLTTGATEAPSTSRSSSTSAVRCAS